VDAIRRGAPSGAHALWSSGSESNSPPSCGVLNEAGLVHGLGSPLRCQRVNVKFMRQHAVRVAGPDRIIFCSSSAVQKSTTENTGFPQRKNRQRNNEGHHCIPLWLFSVFLCALCGNALELAPLHMLRKIALTFAFYSAYTFFWRDEGAAVPT
jgi:hypothetical protein